MEKSAKLDALRAKQRIANSLLQGNFDIAEELCSQVLAIWPNDITALNYKGIVFLKKDRPQDAIDLFMAAIQIDPNAIEPRQCLGEAFEALGQLDEAIRHYKVALSNSASSQLINDLGKRNNIADISLQGVDLPYLNLAFSFTGEDLALRKLFFWEKLSSGKVGFYIDVGCFHPFGMSSTYLFYCYGWHGVCIDANSKVQLNFETHRARDKFVLSAVSNTERSIFFAEHKTNKAENKVSYKPNLFDNNYETPVELSARPLVDILDETVATDTFIDFMSIDVEGHESEVIESNDWDKYRPRVVVVEDHDFRIDNLRGTRTISLLLDAGYKVNSALWPNVYLVDSSEA